LVQSELLEQLSLQLIVVMTLIGVGVGLIIIPVGVGVGLIIIPVGVGVGLRITPVGVTDGVTEGVTLGTRVQVTELGLATRRQCLGPTFGLESITQ
jgi:hypothetical protein